MGYFRVSCRFDFLLKLTRCRLRALILPIALLGSAFGQTGAAGTKTDAPVKFVSMFSSDADAVGNRTSCQHLRDIVRPSVESGRINNERPAVCDQVLNILAGKADHPLVDITAPIRGVKVAVDSHLRVLITEPTTQIVHVLDFANRKYLRIDGAKGGRMSSPYGVAVDADDNIYVTDLKRGRIVVYNADGKFKRYIGDFKGEGLFQDPQSIAIDLGTGRIYLTDTARDFVLILDRTGKVLAQLGKRGGGNGPAEFKQPTEVAIYDGEVFILDRKNGRIQVLDLDGNFRRQFDLGGAGSSDANGMAFDSQGRLFVPALNWVEVFNREGHLLFRFGQSGTQPGEFHAPKGICTDSKDRLYVMDSGNLRVQVFQIASQPAAKIANEANTSVPAH